MAVYGPRSCIDCKFKNLPSFGDKCHECIHDPDKPNFIIADVEDKENKEDTSEIAEKPNNEALLAALKLIRDECNKHEYCNECPLRLCENNCYLLREKSVRPGKWKFDGEENEPKRLFL